MHRLWYDLRTQSMFEPELREAVLEIDATLERMIWRVVGRYAELAGRPPAFDAGTTYALLDGIFEKALLRPHHRRRRRARVAAPPRARRDADAARSRLTRVGGPCRRRHLG